MSFVGKVIISTWVAILIALVSLVVGVGGAYLYLTYYRVTPPSVTEDIAGGTLTVSGQTVSFNYPKTWADLTIPPTNEFGKITTGKLTGALFFAPILNADVQEQLKMFENYPYSQDSFTASDGTEISDPDAAVASLQVYPVTFSDDPAGEYGALTKEQKEAILKPLLDVYAKRSLGETNLVKKVRTGEDSWFKNPIGGLWSSGNDNQDRVGISYYENNDGSFRAVGYFAFEGQDINFHPDYRVILINPNTRTIVVFNFPLRKHPTLQRFVPADDAAEATVTAKLKEMYAYLDGARNYQGTELETLINSFADVVGSLKIQS